MDGTFLPGRRHYEGFTCIPKNLSYMQELREIYDAGNTVCGSLVRNWIPQELADFAGVEINGCPKDEAMLEFGRAWGGCRRIEDIFQQEWWDMVKAHNPVAAQIQQLQEPEDHAVQKSPELPAASPVAAIPISATPFPAPIPAPPVERTPKNPYARAQPYKPTYQTNSKEKRLKYNSDRGNPPLGIGVHSWSKTYDNANFEVAAHNAQKTAAPTARRNGWVRDMALKRLIDEKRLSEDFVDIDP